ncbi:MAG: YlbF family regulator [Limisphaerales bacterium]
MATQIEEKTQELCRTLVAAPEMQTIRKRIDTFMADASVRGQYEALMSKGQALHDKQHNGQTLAAAEIAEFENGRETLLANPVARGFLDAQEELHGIQKSIQKHVAKTLELGRLPTAEDLSEGGSCGEGCGCHH